MQYEVELKFRIVDPSVVERRLASMEVRLGRPVSQVDLYYNHPTRDFAVTDEALRIRWAGQRSWVTYKGPKIDHRSKTRQEIEVPLPDGSEGAEKFQALLGALGFRPSAQVRKTRRHASLRWQGRTCEIAIDRVERLGGYVELEFGATSDDLSEAQESLESLAGHLGLSGRECRSYLELLGELEPERTDP